MSSSRNDDSMKKILRSLKSVKDNGQLACNVAIDNSKLKTCSSASSCSVSSSLSLNMNHRKSDDLNENNKKREKTEKKSIQNMIKSHPLLIDLNGSKDKSRDHDKTNKLICAKKSLVEYDESSEDLNINLKKLVEESDQEDDKDLINNNNHNNNNQFNFYCLDNDKSKKNKKHVSKHVKDNCKKQAKVKSDHCRSKTPNNDCDFSQDQICVSEEVKKKFNRANKVFYNGFLNKQDKNSNCIEYQSHAAQLLRFFKSLWAENKLCDLAIIVNNRKYSAHKVSLAMFSRKYKEEFEKKSQNKDSGIYTINLKNSTCLAIESILSYIYTAKIDINPANVEEILAAAKELGIDDLICMANDYLSSLSFGDILDFLGNMLNKEGSELMFYELYVYMMTHLDKISRTPEFLKSSICVVRAILSDSHLNVCNEIEVFDAGFKWFEFDKQNRFKYLYEIVKNIRFTLIRPEDILKIENQLNINDNNELYRLVYNGYKYHSLNSNQCKLANFIKKEEPRNVCLKGASVPETFVKAIIELTEIAKRLKSERNIFC